ncbi:hypothetical protein P152DRAFT_476634 [Eremomyces bilateralis CBS 781.70]|uniref:Uncharacterized protein n=1 Tax=Eremomyces bilateralis CBS 781.70 TaxID=1392243 RepID=A0A6G1FUC8_9PEZI|nr:uncharacterized protein P152DRAFT_476634 [Eremomyces bilateralis CBS 781.70]KAF1809292.1 hypothetical protein P152DRAFT_476634 [Eremomyces bilateralis CBS 781.70]
MSITPGLLQQMARPGRSKIMEVNLALDKASLRIRWPILGELSDIMVIDDPTDAFSPERPLQLPDDSFHLVANAIALEPPISFVMVKLDCLDYYPFECSEACQCDGKYKDDIGNSFESPPLRLETPSVRHIRT